MLFRENSGKVGDMLTWHGSYLGLIEGQRFNPGYTVTWMITIMAILCHWTPVAYKITLEMLIKGHL